LASVIRPSLTLLSVFSPFYSSDPELWVLVLTEHEHFVVLSLVVFYNLVWVSVAKKPMKFKMQLFGLGPMEKIQSQTDGMTNLSYPFVVVCSSATISTFKV
jgi:hypothetical protein